MSDHVTVDVADQALNRHRVSALVETREAGILLAICSIVLANDGVQHFIRHGLPSTPNSAFCEGFDGYRTHLLSHLVKVIDGLFGLCIGLGAVVMGNCNGTLIDILMATHIIFGSFIFMDSFLISVLTVSRISSPTIPGLTVGASQFIGLMNILTSTASWLALLGGQFVFMARLVSSSTYRDSLRQRSCARMHSIFWNFNLALAGLWAILTAYVVLSRTDPELASAGMFVLTKVDRISVDLFIIGCILLVWAIIGIMISVSGRMQMVRPYVMASFAVFLAFYSGYAIVQPEFITAAGAYVHFVMIITFLGPYFMLKQAQQDIYNE